MEKYFGKQSGIFSKRFMNNTPGLFKINVTPYHEDDGRVYWCETPNYNDGVFQVDLVNQIFKL